jgi:squalene synthase HpnC
MAYPVQGKATLPPDEQVLRVKERAENFPVAARVLPRRHREHLVAVYGVVRTIDDLGDEALGDRAERLDEFAGDLGTIWHGGTPRAAVLRRLRATVRDCRLEPEPFLDLIEANRQDQRIRGYQSYLDLLGYCRLSAQPVGRLVLAIFGASTPARVALSDRICDALQIIEHLQDVAEDRRAGRVYLPAEDLASYLVPPTDLDLPRASPALRALIGFEAGRAADLLDSGAPLVRSLRGWARIAVAGYVAGGRAALDGLRRVGWDVMAGSPGVRKADVLRHLGRPLLPLGGRA